MYQVTRWLEDFALASMGLDANVIEDVSNLSESAIEPILKEKATTLPADEAMKRIAALREIGRNGRRMHPQQFAEVMTTAHFSYYFADAISRAFYADYQYDVGSWRDYTYPDTAPDFRDVARFRMSEPGTLQKRREKAQHSATYVTETEINYAVEEYSREFDVSWRTIMNDDLGKIRETPTRMANAARRWLDQWVSNLYDNATTQAALLALGVVYGGTGRLTAANLAIGLNAMMQRNDAQGNQMNINRVWLVIPKVLEIQAADILQDVLAYGGPGGNVLNQFVAGVRVDPYIGFVAGSANIPWYLFADPGEVPTVTVLRMEGWPGPVVFRRESDIGLISGTAPSAFTMGDFATGNIWFGVEDVVGGWDDATYVGVTDFRGIYFSNGTTP
jgi:hypothetical protein